MKNKYQDIVKLNKAFDKMSRTLKDMSDSCKELININQQNRTLINTAIENNNNIIKDIDEIKKYY